MSEQSSTSEGENIVSLQHQSTESLQEEEMNEINVENAREEQTESIPSQKVVTPLPKLAIVMIAILIIAEAVGYSILYPVVPYMVRDFLYLEQNQTVALTQNSVNLFPVHPIGFLSGGLDISILNSPNITTNHTGHDDSVEISEERIGLLVGILASAFTLSQLISNWFISRASDFIGRKVLLMSGLVSNIVFLSLFAISKNFWYALTIRIVHGFVNANIPIYKSYLIDVTDDSNQQKAFIIVSILWAVSNVISPGIGGWLSKPSEKWPSVFGGEGSFFHNYPYVLPLLLPILLNTISLVSNLIFMKETLKTRQTQKLSQLVNSLLTKIGVKRKNSQESFSEIEGTEQETTLVEMIENPKSDEDNFEITPESNVEEKNENSMLGLFKDKLVLKVVFLYLILATASNMMDEIMPVYFSNSVHKRGLGFDSTSLGIVLSIGGVTSLIMLVIYPKLSERLGFLWMFRIGLLMYAIVVVVFSFSTELVRFQAATWILWVYVSVSVFVKSCASSISYTSQFMMVNNAAPSSNQIGSVNGLAHIFASLGWTVGPFLAGLLLKLGLDWADMIVTSMQGSFLVEVPFVDKLSFLICSLFCLMDFALSFTIPKSIVEKRRYETKS